MRLILFKNKEKCDSITDAMVKDFSAIIGQNQPCPEGATKMFAVEPAPAKAGVKALDLRTTKHFTLCLTSKHFIAQQNINLFASRA